MSFYKPVKMNPPRYVSRRASADSPYKPIGIVVAQSKGNRRVCSCGVDDYADRHSACYNCRNAEGRVIACESSANAHSASEVFTLEPIE